MVAQAHRPASSQSSVAITAPEGVKLPIFMDNHSTTAVDLRVVQAMLPFFTQHYGNAASRNHAFGWTAEAAVDRARGQVAALLGGDRSEEHTSELQSRRDLVCRLLLEKKNKNN